MVKWNKRFWNTYQDWLVIPGNNKRSAGVTAAGAGTSNSTDTYIRSHNVERERSPASQVSNDVEADVAESLEGPADSSTSSCKKQIDLKTRA